MTQTTKWDAIPAQNLTADGASNGILTVADSTAYRVKQKIEIVSDTQPRTKLQITRVFNDGVTIKVGPEGCRPTEVFDASAYLVADNANILAREQDKPRLGGDDALRYAYEQEPTVALRVIQVDELGNPVGASSGGEDAVEVIDVTKGIDVEWDDLQITTFTECDQPVTIEARKDGNLVRTLTMTYDSEDRLTQVVKT